MRNFLFLNLTLFLFVTSGCTGLIRKVVEPPKVEDQRLRVSDVNLTGAQLNLELKIKNPNGFDLPVENLHAKLFLDEKPVLTQVWNDLPVLLARQSTDVKLPIKITWNQALEASTLILQRKKIPYRAEGTVQVKGITVPFNEKGEISASE